MRITKNRLGAMLPLVAVGLVIFTVVMVFSVDVARMHLVRAELRLATDAAARAGAEALSREQNSRAAIDAAVQIAAANFVGGRALDLETTDITLGSATSDGNGKFEFEAGRSPTNSVHVNADPGNVRLFLGGMLGRETFRPTMDAVAMRLDRDIAVVLDSSGSMGSQNRFAGLRIAFIEFLRVLEDANGDDYLSLIDYDTSARLVQPVTSNLTQIRNGFDRLRVGGLTAIGDGILTGSNSLSGGQSRPQALKTIIVMTDGQQNRGTNPVSAARTAANRGHVIHTVTFGRGANQSLMRRVAGIGNGIHLHADNNSELVEKFREIALQLPVVLTE